ncbi:hypothetical protein AB0O90_17085 [Microbacterium testaceum]|uniref:hypothetical protein n=1 Tax=Microbacterium testaceum TaxID=2033 RepID=UPI0034144AC9
MRAAAATAMAAALLLAGCSSAPAPEIATGPELVKQLAQQAREAGYEESASRLEDGVIDKNEYDAAFGDMRSCFEGLGMTLEDVSINRGDGIRYIYRVEGSGFSQNTIEDADAACTDRYFSHVDSAYIATTPPKMDEPLRVATIECMRSAGYDMSGSEATFADIAVSPDADGGRRYKTADSCATEAVLSLYPDEPGIVLSF